MVDTLRRYTHAISVALGHRDHGTLQHSDRVGQLSIMLGRQRGLCERELAILHIGASLHDVGKIGVRDAVLSKPARLDDSERAEMNRHPVIGQDIILATAIDGADEAAQVVRHHHEHFDGSGYPDGLVGEAIPLAARIISITDSYDAMSVTRAYHRPRSHDQIVEVLHAEAGSKHDPILLGEFLALIEHGPLRAR